MLKVIFIVLLMIALLVYSQRIENYQNFSYYSGYGGPIYSGVPSDGAPYVQPEHGQTSPQPPSYPQHGNDYSQPPQYYNEYTPDYMNNEQQYY